MKVSTLALLGAAATASQTVAEESWRQRPMKSDNTRTKPLIDTEALQKLIKKENLLKKAEDLYAIAKLSEPEYNHPTRVIGSLGHIGTVEYIYESLANMSEYYTFQTQAFSAFSGAVFESRLIVANAVSLSALPMSLSPPTTNNEPVHGDIILVRNNGCEVDDFPSAVSGNIALIRRGDCSFAAKSANAGRANATVALIHDNLPSESFTGTLSPPTRDHVATFGITLDTAEAIIANIKKGKTVDAIAYIDSVVKEIVTNNIIAQTLGGDPDHCVMIGGHSDSVTEGPGINDDGTGSLTVLEVATQLTKFEVNNCVRFAWWAGEEEGLLGSDYYVSTLSPEENMKIRMFMDYDMMASPNFAYQIYNATNAANPEGSEQVRDMYADWYDAHGLNYTFIPFDGRSDYDGFIKNSIPGGGIATGAEGLKSDDEQDMFGGKAGDAYDVCYHELCDDVSNVNLTAWEVNTKLVAHSVATYARSLKDFPKRELADLSAQAEKPLSLYRGHKLQM